MDEFQTIYPTLCDLLVGTSFEADAKAALAKSNEDLEKALNGRVFVLNELMWLLCGTVFLGCASPKAAQLESDLATIVAAVGIDAARAAYKDKFLIEAKSKVQDPQAKSLDAEDKLEDVRYELAVTAKACAVLDTDSVQLEKPIPDPAKDKKDWKNSDLFGTFQGQPVRIEITVLHESLPLPTNLELYDLVKNAEIASGFYLTLRSVLINQDYAERVRALIELLHEHHMGTGGEDIEIDGVHFEWNPGAYHCPHATSPIESICFYAASEFVDAEKKREINLPCSVRSVTSKHVLEDYQNPPGVFTSADLPNVSTQVPVSTKVRQILARKLQQSEEGVINIVAFGNPLPMHDREVVNAVLGSEFVDVQFCTDMHGARHSEKAYLQRDRKAPFVPAQCLPSSDDRTQFIDPFQKMSAVWHIRIGSHAKSEVFANPNASLPIPKGLAEAFSEPVQPSTPVDVGQQVDDGTTRLTDSQPDDCEQEDLVWSDLARELVLAFGTVAGARLALVELEQSGLSLECIRNRVEQVWAEPLRHEKKSKLISATNQEMAMTFVVECGGYQQAKSCLEAYVERI